MKRPTITRVEIPFSGVLVLQNSLWSEKDLKDVGTRMLENLQRQVNDGRTARMELDIPHTIEGEEEEIPTPVRGRTKHVPHPANEAGVPNLET